MSINLLERIFKMKELIERARNKEREAFEKIYSLYKNQIYYFCVRLIPDQVQSRELTLETFACAFDRIDTLEETEQFEIWIKNIAAIKCFNYIHKMKPMLFLQASDSNHESLFTEADLETFEQGTLDETKSAAVMDKMLSRLDDAQRMTLMFHYYNGLSVAQIAKIMSCSQDMVKLRTHASAERMKNTLAFLEGKGIILSEVDFRTVLQLMAACASVPQEIDAQVQAHISEMCEETVPETPPKPSYSFENYVSSLETREPGELESSVSKYTGNEASGLSDSEPFIRTVDIKSGAVSKNKTSSAPNDKAKRGVQNARRSTESAKRKENGVLKKFRSLSVTQQSVALLVALAIIATVIIAAALPHRKKDLEPPVSSTASTVSKTVSKTVSSEPQKSLSLEFKDEENTLKASDGTVIAKSSYQYPVATIPSNTAAAEKINSFFNSEKAEIMSTYTSEEKKAECELMYSQKAYGDWKANETSVKMAGGRADEKVMSFEKSLYTFSYGNIYGITEFEAYCFSSETGEQLKIADIVSDRDAYYTFASDYIKNIAEEKQNAGDFSLYSDYVSTISSTVKDDSRWYLTDTGLKILFEADEIVYFTYGAQSVEIPYSELTSYLKAEYIPQ